jgi:hypothetical protein
VTGSVTASLQGPGVPLLGALTPSDATLGPSLFAPQTIQLDGTREFVAF